MEHVIEHKIKMNNFMTRILTLFRELIRVEPVIINIIAILLAIGMLALMNYPTLLPKLGKYHVLITYILYGLIILQTIRAASRSLIIPMLAITLAGIGFILYYQGPNFQAFMRVDILKQLMLLGIIGGITSVFKLR